MLWRLSRDPRCEDFVVGSANDENAFVHTSLAILPGRGFGIKRHAAELLDGIVKKHFSKTLADVPCSVTVEVRELDGDSYQKAVSID